MFLKNCDFLSPNITLYYYNKKRHSSVIGGLLSLIMIILYIDLMVKRVNSVLCKLNLISLLVIVRV